MREINKVYLMDNLEFMKSIDSNSIDLIYIDPPFYSQNDYGDFNDKWDGLDVYLEFMKVRIEEIHRILKDTGSFYLHCDNHASHYLKIILDKIFERKYFKNEIIWYYDNKYSSKRDFFSRSHDIILFYTKSDKYTYNPLLVKKLIIFPIKMIKVILDGFLK